MKQIKFKNFTQIFIFLGMKFRVGLICVKNVVSCAKILNWAEKYRFKVLNVQKATENTVCYSQMTVEILRLYHDDNFRQILIHFSGWRLLKTKNETPKTKTRTKTIAITAIRTLNWTDPAWNENFKISQILLLRLLRSALECKVFFFIFFENLKVTKHGKFFEFTQVFKGYKLESFHIFLN